MSNHFYSEDRALHVINLMPRSWAKYQERFKTKFLKLKYQVYRNSNPRYTSLDENLKEMFQGFTMVEVYSYDDFLESALHLMTNVRKTTINAPIKIPAPGSPLESFLRLS